MNNYLTSFDPLSMIRDILKQWLVILLTAAGVTMLVYVWISYTYVPEYTTSTTFVVTERSNNGDPLSGLTSAEETTQRFAEVLDGSLLKKAVKEDLKLEEFTAKTSCKQVPSTNMISLSVTSGTAYESFMIMKSILKNYGTISDYLVGDVYLEILEQPSVPTGPSNLLNKRRPIQLAFLGTVIVLVALIAFFSYNRDTVKNYAQFKEKVDTYSLGAIYHERKSGGKHVSRFGTLFFGMLDTLIKSPDKIYVSMLIDNPARSFRYVESLRLVAASLRSRMDQAKAKVLLVTSVTENEGKSTVTANLALSLAQEGKSVLLIDADFRKPSQHLIYGLEEGFAMNFNEYLCKKGGQMPKPARYKNYQLLIMANSHVIEDADSAYIQENMRRVIEFYRKRMDYIILDSSPVGLISDTETVASLSDRSLLVVREDMVLVPHINDTIDELSRSGAACIGAVLSDATPGKIGAHDAYGGYGGTYGTNY